MDNSDTDQFHVTENSDEEINNEGPDKKFWAYDETITLIQIVERRKNELHHPKARKHIWTNISNDLLAHNIMVTATCCQKKWQNLLRSYKSVKDNKKRRGRGPMRFNFYKEIDDLLGSDPNIVSPHIINCSNIKIEKVVPLPKVSPVTISEAQIILSVDNTPTLFTGGGESSSTEATEPLLIEVEKTEDTQVYNGGKKRKKCDECREFKQRYYSLKAEEYKKRRENKKANEEAKLKLYTRKLLLEERKIRALEELIALKKR